MRAGSQRSCLSSLRPVSREVKEGRGAGGGVGGASGFHLLFSSDTTGIGLLPFDSPGFFCLLPVEMLQRRLAPGALISRRVQ